VRDGREASLSVARRKIHGNALERIVVLARAAKRDSFVVSMNPIINACLTVESSRT
jgi:hypothetical protein